MSGESLGGIKYPLEYAAQDILIYAYQHKLLLWQAFARHLYLVAEALDVVNYEMSGDGGDGDAAIKAVLGEHWRELSRQAALDECRAYVEQLERMGE